MVTQRAGYVGGWAAHGCIVSRHIFEVNQTYLWIGGSDPSRTTRRWVPRSSTPSSVAIDDVITSPALR
jgi:hypothetical protein